MPLPNTPLQEISIKRKSPERDLEVIDDEHASPEFKRVPLKKTPFRGALPGTLAVAQSGILCAPYAQVAPFCMTLPLSPGTPPPRFTLLTQYEVKSALSKIGKLAYERRVIQESSPQAERSNRVVDFRMM
jgi:hypothetical protein